MAQASGREGHAVTYHSPSELVAQLRAQLRARRAAWTAKRAARAAAEAAAANAEKAARTFRLDGEDILEFKGTVEGAAAVLEVKLLPPPKKRRRRHKKAHS